MEISDWIIMFLGAGWFIYFAMKRSEIDTLREIVRDLNREVTELKKELEKRKQADIWHEENETEE